MVIFVLILFIFGIIGFFMVKKRKVVTPKQPLWVGLRNPSITDVVALLECADNLLYVSIAVALDSDIDDFFSKLDKVAHTGSEFVSACNTDNIDKLWHATNQQEKRMLVLPKHIRPSRGWDSKLSGLNSDKVSLGKNGKSILFWYGSRVQWNKAANLTSWLKHKKQTFPLKCTNPIFTKNHIS